MTRFLAGAAAVVALALTAGCSTATGRFRHGNPVRTVLERGDKR